MNLFLISKLLINLLKGAVIDFAKSPSLIYLLAKLLVLLFSWLLVDIELLFVE